MNMSLFLFHNLLTNVKLQLLTSGFELWTCGIRNNLVCQLSQQTFVLLICFEFQYLLTGKS